MNLLNTNNLKQLGLLTIIILMVLTIIGQMSSFIPGILGAITLYILLRNRYNKLVKEKGWKKWIAATVLIVLSIILFAVPVFFLFQAFIPKINQLLSETDLIQQTVKDLAKKLEESSIPISLDSKQILSLVQNVTSEVPAILGATANMLTNGVLAFFFLYFMLVQSEQMEKETLAFVPLKAANAEQVWKATKTMVYSNAVGIPLLAACQGLVAILGYWIFGVESYLQLGVLTGIFSIVPMVGCAIVWVPICIYLGVTGHTTEAIGLCIYSIVVTGGVDNVLRFTLLKKLGDVHPIITTIGIIIGIPLFGFMGFIFGPLLVSYMLLLVKIYRVEYSSST